MLRLTQRSGLIHTGFHEARATWDNTIGRRLSVQVRGWHPLRPGLQACSPGKPFYDSRPARRNRDTRSRNTGGRNPRRVSRATMVWSDPLSLATTHGVSLPAGTEMFHFPAYPPNHKVRCRPMTAGGFPHSEILGSKPCWRLPEAYRILKRPSSVLSAKASTIRPCKAAQQPRQIAPYPHSFLIARSPDDKSSHCKK